MSVMHSPSKETSCSAPNLTNIADLNTATAMVDNSERINITLRKEKRKRGDVVEEDIITFMDEIRSMIALNREDQNRKFDTIYTAMKEIKDQNHEISKSLDFMSQKYEEIRQQIQKNEEERKKDLAYIRELESRLTNVERSSRNTSIEIRNLPNKTPETKKDLINMVKSIGTAIKTELVTNDIKDLFRYHSKSSSRKPIIVEFVTTLKKEEFLESARSFRKNNNFTLTTQHINLSSNPDPIYISESLPALTKKLHAQARKFASEYKYKYCWTKHGYIFLRKDDGGMITQIDSEDDIKKLVSISSK
uniref:FP protein C-terminal domain-containing protein n=1 Tax=Pectinophora gossypiella TaxID=13191 RepID=A0A1E1W072_PECGO